MDGHVDVARLLLDHGAQVETHNITKLHNMHPCCTFIVHDPTPLPTLFQQTWSSYMHVVRISPPTDTTTCILRVGPGFAYCYRQEHMKTSPHVLLSIDDKNCLVIVPFTTL